MGLGEVLRQVELFQGLDGRELELVRQIFEEIAFTRGEVIAAQGAPGDQLYLISEGFVEVAVETHPGELQSPSGGQVLINLGKGQIFGEMALVDEGPRSATVSAISDQTIVHAANRSDFSRLWEEHPHIGYVVMRNIAADLSFKLRKQNLARRPGLS